MTDIISSSQQKRALTASSNETQFGLLVGTPILSGSLIRLILGIWSDQYGGRIVYVVVMVTAAIATFFLSYPPTDYIVHGIKGDITFSLAIEPLGFIILLAILGLFMSFGKAAVYKHIPVYYPDNVGAGTPRNY